MNKGKKRSNGDGSIFKLSENKWVAKIYLGTGPNGEWQVKQFSGQTEAIVKKKLRDYKRSAEFIERHAPAKDTVAAYFDKWMKEYQLNKLKPSSYDRLESTVLTHVLPNLGKLRMDKVTRDKIQSLINSLHIEKDLSYSSIKKVYVALNACFTHALTNDVVLKNPCIGVTLPPATAKQVLALTPNETKMLKSELSKTYSNGKPIYIFAPAFLLILNTGLRIGEALSLSWEDVDFKNKCISVNKNAIMARQRDKKGSRARGYKLLTQNSPKTDKSNRIIPINNSAEEALKALKTNNNTEYVIVNSRKHRVLPSNFERSFHAALKNANIDGKYGVHSLRHTFASLMFANGVDVKIVSELLGHSTVKITYDIYVHLFANTLRNVTDVLD